MNIKNKSAASNFGNNDEQYTPDAFPERQEKMTALLQLVDDQNAKISDFNKSSKVGAHHEEHYWKKSFPKTPTIPANSGKKE